MRRRACRDRAACGRGHKCSNRSSVTLAGSPFRDREGKGGTGVLQGPGLIGSVAEIWRGDAYVERSGEFDVLRKPRLISSRPETEARRIAARSGSAARKASRATRASADSGRSSASRIAPAPSRSSMAGRRLPSLHCSPAGTMPTAPSRAMTRVAAATALALRRHPVRTGTGPLADDKREPLDDGSSSLAPLAIATRLTGDKL